MAMVVANAAEKYALVIGGMVCHHSSMLCGMCAITSVNLGKMEEITDSSDGSWTHRFDANIRGLRHRSVPSTTARVRNLLPNLKKNGHESAEQSGAGIKTISFERPNLVLWFCSWMHIFCFEFASKSFAHPFLIGAVCLCCFEAKIKYNKLSVCIKLINKYTSKAFVFYCDGIDPTSCG